jgi:hypothetical protein
LFDYSKVSTTVIEAGIVPEGNGEPNTGVKVPVVLSIANPDTLFAEPFVTYKKLSERSKLSEYGSETPSKGEVGSSFKLPVLPNKL